MNIRPSQVVGGERHRRDFILVQAPHNGMEGGRQLTRLGPLGLGFGLGSRRFSGASSCQTRSCSLSAWLFFPDWTQEIVETETEEA